jgi:hypothetical protein
MRHRLLRPSVSKSPDLPPNDDASLRLPHSLSPRSLGTFKHAYLSCPYECTDPPLPKVRLSIDPPAFFLPAWHPPPLPDRPFPFLIRTNVPPPDFLPSSLSIPTLSSFLPPLLYDLAISACTTTRSSSSRNRTPSRTSSRSTSSTTESSSSPASRDTSLTRRRGRECRASGDVVAIASSSFSSFSLPLLSPLSSSP